MNNQINTYYLRYFIEGWPELCRICYEIETNKIIGVILGKICMHKERKRGYIAMLTVSHNHRKMGIGSRLVDEFVNIMKLHMVDEIVLETEIENKASLQLYDKFGFIRDKKLDKYYWNGNDAFRLKLWVT